MLVLTRKKGERVMIGDDQAVGGDRHGGIAVAAEGVQAAQLAHDISRRHRADPVHVAAGRAVDRAHEARPAREREVSARAAFGMSVEATALELGIAMTSVLTLRQRAYRRLGVASARELLWLVAH